MKGKYKQIKKTRFIQYIVAMLVLFIVASLVFSSLQKSYESDIEKMRSNKDSRFFEDPESPIEDKDKFKGLEYFTTDKHYRVVAKLTVFKNQDSLLIIRNDGKNDLYFRFGNARFKLDGKEYTLLLLRHAEPANKNSLFLPFTDLTNGKETYGAGRYIDLKYEEGENEIEIDFNLAYNPYCAYSYRYGCPIPPRENHLATEIRAGEKKYLEKD